MNRRTVLSLHSKQELFAAKDLDVLTFNGRPAAKAKNTALRNRPAAVALYLVHTLF